MRNKGFTLIEIIVVVAIMALLFSIGIIMTMDAYRGFGYRSERDVIVSVLERARSRAMANIDQSAWGVCYRNSNYVIFKGTTCTETNSDLVPVKVAVEIASDFEHKFPNPVVFTQLTGTTTPTSTKVVQDTASSTISINYEGTINW